MIKYLIYLCSCVCLFACRNQSATVLIAGKVDSCSGTKVILVNPDDHAVLDSAVIENGRFKLNSTVEKEGFYQLLFSSPVVGNKSWSHPCLMYLENKALYTFSANRPNDILYNRYTIKTTSADQLKINELQKLESDLSTTFRHRKKEIGAITDQYLASGKDQLYRKFQDSLFKLDSLAVAENNQLRKRFIKQNRGTLYTPYLINQAPDRFESYQLYRETLNHLDARVKDSEMAKDASTRLDRITKLYIGASVPPLTGLEIDNRNTKPDYAQSKYTLIDFWASYCVPCRKQMPELRRLYTRYSRKKLNVVSVSIDENRRYWIVASNQDSIPWLNIAEIVPTSQSQNIRNFAVKVIPANYLIDQQGKILARDIAIDELERLLSK